MSFSSQAKDELVKIRTEGRSSNMALLSGLIRVSGSLTLPSLGLKLVTEHPKVARLAHSLLKKLYGISAEIETKRTRAFSTRHVYEVKVLQAQAMLEELGVVENFTIVRGMAKELAIEDEAFRVYLRGIFLGCGSITAPEKGYHMELAVQEKLLAEELSAKMNRLYDLGAKVISRKTQYMVYVKESEKIVDFLTIIGAVSTLFSYEDVRILKQMRNDVNRVVNCETANIGKTTEAAVKQMEAIAYLQEIGAYRSLSDKQKEVAEARMENPELTLLELGQLLDPPVGKSGVNHRLAKIVERADQEKERR